MGEHRASTTSRTPYRVGGTLLLLGASLAVASPSAFAAGTSADGGTVTGGSGGSADSANSNGGAGGEAGNGGQGGRGGNHTETTSPSSSAGLLGSGLLGTGTTGSRFANCTEARAAGRENIPRGDPDYAPKLDGDNSGIACENPPSSKY